MEFLKIPYSFSNKDYVMTLNNNKIVLGTVKTHKDFLTNQSLSELNDVYVMYIIEGLNK